MYLNREPLVKNSKARFLLVKDTNTLSGVNVYKAIMKKFCQEHTNVYVLCYEGLTEDLLYGLNVDRDKVNAIDLLSDPFSWNNSEISPSLVSADAVVKKFLDFRGGLFIYSLTSMLIHNGSNAVYRALHKLLKMNADLQVVALLHADVHDSVDNHLIEKLASTVLEIQTDDKEQKLLSTVHYASGRVSNHTVEFKISESFEFSMMCDVKLQNKNVPTKQPDPTANLTFNLKLTDEDKEARNKLQLPYMKMQTSDDAVIQSLLENDFYDEEDPDDDLDI